MIHSTRTNAAVPQCLHAGFCDNAGHTSGGMRSPLKDDLWWATPLGATGLYLLAQGLVDFAPLPMFALAVIILLALTIAIVWLVLMYRR
jgi:hypothetical protein